MYTNTSARRSVRGSFGPSKSICSQADSILTIQQKRDLYDQVGEEGLKGGAGAGGGGGGFGGGFPGGGGGGFNGFHAGDPNDIFKYVDPLLSDVSLTLQHILFRRYGRRRHVFRLWRRRWWTRRSFKRRQDGRRYARYGRWIRRRYAWRLWRERRCFLGTTPTRRDCPTSGLDIGRAIRWWNQEAKDYSTHAQWNSGGACVGGGLQTWMEEGMWMMRYRSLYTDRQGTKVKFAGAGNEDEHGQSQ
jgi:hypothetical protein